MSNKIFTLGIVTTVLVALIAGLMLGSLVRPAPAAPVVSEAPMGGTVYNRLIEFSEGISVDGTTIIDGSGNWDGAITGTTGTFSSTLAVTGTLTVSATSTLASTTLVGVLTVSGDTALSSDLAVTGTTTMASTTMTWADINNGLIDGTPVGSGTAATGAFTTLSASATSTLASSSIGGIMIVGDGVLLDFSAVPGGTVSATEGLKLPQATSCTNQITEGLACWDTDNDVLYIGDSASALSNFNNTASANTWTGDNTFHSDTVTLGLSSTSTLTVNSTSTFAATSTMTTTTIAYLVGSAGTIDNMVVGGTTPLAGSFTTLTITATSTQASTTITWVDINNGLIDGTPVGSVTAATGAFTTLTASATSTLASTTITWADINNGLIDGTPIGSGTPSTGAFTTLSASGLTTMASTTMAGYLYNTNTSTIGWVVKAGANVACNTTCSSYACVFGWNTDLTTTTAIIACDSALADSCLCAGPE